MTTVPPFDIGGGIIRPALTLDQFGNIILDGPASIFAETYGTKALYAGLPANTPFPPISAPSDTLSAPIDINPVSHSVVEGAAVNTPTSLAVSATSSAGNPVTYSLTGDSSGGGFKINPNTGAVSVADFTKIDYEANASHSFTVTVQAMDGALTSSQNFTIAVTDPPPTTPVNTNAGTPTVVEHAAAGTPVGVTASSTTSANDPAATYSLTNSANGAFQINATTGLVTVADPTKIDYQTAPTLTITVQANDGTAVSSQNFSIAVTDVNVAPSGTSNTVTALEDLGYAFKAADFGFTDTSDIPHNALTAVKITTVPAAGTLTDNGVAVGAGAFVSIADINAGLLEFTPAANVSGSGYATFTFQVKDDGGTANGGVDTDPTPKTMTVNVTQVNDAPSFTIGANATSLEDAGAQTVANFATAISPGPGANESGQTVHFNVTNDTNAGLFAVGPAIASNGTLTYTAAAGVSGVATITVAAQDNGGTANGGVDTSAAQTFTINVNNVNDAPSGTSKTVTSLEDASYIFTAADFGFTDPSDSSANHLNAVKITTLPAAGTGTLTDNGNPIVTGSFIPIADINGGLLKFTPTANTSGSPEASFTFQVQDDGGVANGGVDTDPTPKTITFNVTQVNDAPSFTVGANQTVLEDTGAHTVNGFATAISPGPGANEAGQTVSFVVSNDTNAGLFAVGPAIDATGKLTYALAANANGTAIISVHAHDNGGTANGGVDSSADQSFTIIVNSVNDAPSGADKTITTLEDHSYTFAAADFGFTDPNDSPANSLLAVKITTLPTGGTLTDNGNPVVAGNFIPIADITGSHLVFTPTANANGAAEGAFTFQVQDTGGTANGGVDTDPTPKTMTVNVTTVNDAPVGTDKTVAASGAYTIKAADFGFTDPIDALGASGANHLKAVEITTLPTSGTLTDNGIAVTTGTFVSVADISANKLVFTPTGNTSASFTFQVQDDGGTANGGIDTDPTPRTLTITQDIAPTVTAGHTLAYLEDQAATAIDPAITVTDPDNANLASAKVQITGNYVQGQDILAFTNTVTITGAFDALTGTLTLIGSDTKANYQTALDSVTYFNNSGNPSTAARTVTITANDGTLDSAPATDTITVTKVNDAPSGANNTVTSLEDASYTFVVADFGFTDTQDSPADTLQAVKITTLPAGGTLTDNGNPVVAGNFIPVADITGGHLVFTPTANTSGSPDTSFTFQVQDNGGTANGGVDTDPAPKTMTINVTLVNDVPSFSLSASATSLEDAGAQSVANFATSISPGVGANESGQTVSFVVTNDTNAGLFAVGPAIDATGKLTYTAAAGVNGTATITLHAHDNGGTLNGGVDTSADQTFTINVNKVNDAPSGTSNTVTALEDSSHTFTVADFGFTDTQDSPADTLQAVKITTLPAAGTGTLTDNGNPVIAGAFIPVADITGGHLVFTPTANTSGAAEASFTFQVQDNGGTASGGVDTDPTPKTMTVDVTQVNDAPSFTAGASATSLEDAGAQSVAGFVTAISPGVGANESGQTVNFVVSSDSNAGLFSVAPAIDANGQLTYTAAPGAVGSATIAVHAHDNGGTANGGVDTSADQTFTVNVTDPAPSVPTDTDNAANSVAELAPVGTAVGITAHSTVTATDPAPTYSITSDSTGTGFQIDPTSGVVTVADSSKINDDSSATITVQASEGGLNSTANFTIAITEVAPVATADSATVFNTVQSSVNVLANDTDIENDALTAVKDTNPAHGTVALNSNGTFTYTNTGGYYGADSFTYHANDGTTNSNTATVTLDVQPNVAYIDNTQSAVGEDGSFAHPFASITDFNTFNATHHYDIIYVEKGTGTYSDAGIVLKANQVLDGQGVDASYVRSDNSATVLLHDFSNTNSDVPTLSFASGNAVTLSTNNTIQGINIVGTSSANGIADIAGGVGTLSLSGVHITTASGTGLSLTHGGTATATSTTATATDSNVITNSISSGTGTALDVANTNIGSGNLTFHDISANGAVDGIVLNTTGSSGGLIVTGDGASDPTNTTHGNTTAKLGGGTIALGSGGTIQNTTGSGIILTNTHGVSLGDMNILNNGGSTVNSGNNGITATNVDGLTLDNDKISGSTGNSGLRGISSASAPSINNLNMQHTDIDGNGTAVGTETNNNWNVRLDDLAGTGAWQNSLFFNSRENIVGLQQGVNLTNPTLNLTITNSEFRDTTTFASPGNDAFGISAFNNAVTNVTATGSTFKNVEVTGFQYAGNDSSSGTVNVRNSFFENTGTDVNIAHQGGNTPGATTLNFDVSGNTERQLTGNPQSTVAINVFLGGNSNAGSKMIGKIENNTIGNVAVAGSGSHVGDGIDVNATGAGTITTTVTGNTVHQIHQGDAFFAEENSGSGRLNLFLHNNSLNTDSTGLGLAGAQLVGGAQASDTGSLLVDMGGNTLNGDSTYTGIELDAFSNVANAIQLVGLSSTFNDNATAIGNFVGASGATTPAGVNTVVSPKPAFVTIGAGSHIIGIASSGVTFPLLAALGGVQGSPQTPGETHLTQAELNTVIAAAIAQWAAAGASASQLAALHATTFSVADLPGTIVGEETAPAHITIDTNAAGHGWFIDPTPSNNSEFKHPANAAGTDLYTDPTNAAAGHLDLLTAVNHELGHVIGLPDSTASSDANDLMYISLVDGERRLPVAADVAQASATTPAQGPVPVPAPMPTVSIQSAHQPVVTGTADTSADNFKFANAGVTAATPPPAAHGAEHSFVPGETFDFSALTSQFHPGGVNDAMIVRAVEDPSGTFATLQVNTNSMGLKYGPTWVDAAQLDGAHPGDAVGVLVDSGSPVHLAQIHVDLLV